jgi:shikimate dehydrogenase
MKALSGHTQPFAVLGHPIGHTLSPVMHNAAFEALGMDAIYLAFDVAPERLMGVLPAMRDMGFRGVNLTVPLKEVAFRGFPDLEPGARALGAVNTVQFLPEGLKGHNTDGLGFLRAVAEAFGLSVTGKTLFVLGCGGAGRAVAITAAKSGAARLILADIDDGRSQRLATELAMLTPGVTVTTTGNNTGAWLAPAREADLLVQASPIGMKPADPCPLPPEAFRAGHLAFDLVYNLPETGFMRAAAAGGAQAVNGLGMLLHQGAEAFSIWTGRPAPIDVMRQALQAALYKR